jgi:hypothetical protein
MTEATAVQSLGRPRDTCPRGVPYIHYEGDESAADLRRRSHPLFVAVALCQALTHDGFDLGRHALSALRLADLGWIHYNAVSTQGLQHWEKTFKNWNEDPKPFVLAKAADEIFNSLHKYIARISGAEH